MPRFDVDNYISVQDRINQFWTDHPKGRIGTALHELSNLEEVIVMAEVWKESDTADDDGGWRYRRPDATGMAQEKKGTGGANNTSWLENAETSAIGRALANLGYATSQADRPSAEEMEKVNRAAPAPVRPSPKPAAAASAAPASEEDETARTRLMQAAVLSSKQKGIADEDRKVITTARFGKESWRSLDMAEIETLKGWIARHDRKAWTEIVMPILKSMLESDSGGDMDEIGVVVASQGLADDVDLIAAGKRIKAALTEAL